VPPANAAFRAALAIADTTQADEPIRVVSHRVVHATRG
jgi:hypothetical protein